MNTGKIVGGIILLAIAAWLAVLMPVANMMAKYLSGAVVGITGLVLVIIGLKKEKAKKERKKK